VSPSVSAPAHTPTQAELLDFVRRAAADAALIDSLPLDPEGRTWVRLEGPASGELKEKSLAARLPTDGWRTLELTEGVDRERRLTAGKGRSFGRHHVHEVLNESTEKHAISVHAYYPPLPQIRRYSRTGQVLRLEQVERPEDWQ
jgi:hypothetical protein